VQTSLAYAGPNARSEPRDQVLHRARAMRADGAALPVTIVDLSPNGLMARCDAAFEAGERITVALPVVGVVRAEVRWSLGGRIGCRLDPSVPIARYYELLAAMR
jgi:hypothetical protein